ncbi:MAG TPA: GTPase [Azospirillaceae bacterium]|nr:GTPase [Azospirillaceae bacterium]
MRLKSFHSPTMAEAMRQVREVLGDDAIIVATREEEGVGVRVTAAVEEDDGYSASPAPRGALFSHAEPVGPDVLDMVSEALLRHGVPAELNQRLIDTLDDFDARDAQMALGAALDAVLSFQPLAEARFSRPVMLVGPPGSGKTLTVAKLCVRGAMRGHKVGVVTTDTVRAGGIDQLQAFTRVLKLRLITVEDPLSLSDALEVQRGMDQLLIDTAGRNPYSAADMSELRDFLVAADIEPVLVLPAGMDPVEAAETAHLFKALGCRRLLPTRLDAARRMGGLLNAAAQAGLAFCDAGVTHQVADGLKPLSPTSLAQILMPEAPASAQHRPSKTGTHS